MRSCIKKLVTHVALLPLLVAGVLLAVGCGRSAGGGGDADVLPLFFTSQTHGRLTHCGCFSGQFGGVARLGGALDALTVGARPLGLDVGDALEGAEDYHLMKHRRVLQAYSKMGYVALNVGSREAALSADGLRALAESSPVPLISANVRAGAADRPLLPGHVVVRHGGRRVGIVGVVDPATLDGDPGEGVVIERMETALARLLPEIRREADVLILLAYTDEHTLAQLAARFYEFAVVLGGDVSQPAQELQKSNQSYVYYTGNESKSFGMLKLKFQPDGSVTAGHSQMVLLHDQYPEAPDILALLDNYRAEVARTPLAIDDPARARAGQVPGVRAAAGYVDTPTCTSCHPAAGVAWHGSGHARAFAVLQARGAEADPSCVGCHTVGFGTETGYRREMGDARLINVGCESCHGPGERHVRERSSDGPITFHFRPLATGDCLKCHQGEFSRPFDWEAFWPRIKHGKENAR